MRQTLITSLALGVLASPGAATKAFAQGYPGPGLNFQTRVGSFKILGTDDPAQGRLEIEFTGTVLINQLQGRVQVSGNLRKEYENVQRGRVAYFGKGKLVMEGKFRAVQFFGRDLKGRFLGIGIARLFGEFDRNLETGLYWYDGNEKIDWGTGGRTVQVPMPATANTIKPKVKDVKG